MLSKITSITGIIISLVLLAGATLYIAYWRGVNQPLQSASEEVLFTIEPQLGVSDISQKLQADGLIAKPLYFDMYVGFKNLDRRLQAGEYLLNKNMSVRELAKVLSQGDPKNRERTIQIIEGWNIADMAEYLYRENIIEREQDFIALTTHEPGTCFSIPACDASFLADIPPEGSLEGYLFPDTYRIFRDASPEDIIAKMLNNFDAKLTDDLRAAIAAQGKTLHEIIIMASIIEKEVRSARDMQTVAGIFWNREKIGMALQSDATLSYVLKDKKPSHTLAELALDSPYNTYKYPALPPGPIASPGLNAIKAAIYPAQTDYFYFLSDLETGQTYFAKTLDEHNQNKRLYLK